MSSPKEKSKEEVNLQLFLKATNSTNMSNFTVHLQDIADESVVFNSCKSHRSGFTELTSEVAIRRKGGKKTRDSSRFLQFFSTLCVTGFKFFIPYLALFFVQHFSKSFSKASLAFLDHLSYLFSSKPY
jgi:hypothetical protein